MEGMTRFKDSVLSVERSFAGSRLEKQVLAAAYELVIPRLEQPRTGSPHEGFRWITQLRSCGDTTARALSSTAVMARGA